MSYTSLGLVCIPQFAVIYFGIWYFLFAHLFFSFSIYFFPFSSGRCVTLSSLNTARFSQLIPKYEQQISLLHVQISWFYYLSHPFIRTHPKAAFITHISHRYKCMLIVKMRRFDKSNDKVTNEVAFQMVMMMVMCITEGRLESSAALKS